MSDNAEYVGNLVAAIIETGKVSQENWEEFSLVLGFDGDGVNDTYGYSYDGSGKWKAFSIRPRLINKEAEAYRNWLRQKDDKPFIKMLFQFNRENNGFNADFEYEDPSRWKVTPANIDSVIEELRPKLNR